MSTPEEKARENIDRQLEAAGWRVQDLSALNLSAARGVAVRELSSQGGPADYVLFADGKAIGVVEAKKEGTLLSIVAEQSARYSHARRWIPQRWADPLPFTYETTGIETNFVDQRDPDARSRPVFAFHRPEHLVELVNCSGGLRPPADNSGGDTPPLQTLRHYLKYMPFRHPLIEAPLRDCQVKAITGLENSLSENRPRALLQMATGSGKTFTAVTLAYRLIKHAGARRILFLVDRGNLGRQTVNEFQQFTTPDDGRKFTDLYNVQMLGPAGIDPVCKVTVSTIQRLYSQLTNNPLDDEADEHSGYELDGTLKSGNATEPLPVSYNPAIPIETFDFIIVDECHRSIYNLWRQVLDYFDAFLIGLTATPSKATLGFFNRNLVTEYPHVQAVADGVNVGYDIYRIKTKISEGGTRLDAGFDYQKRDRLTREKRWAVQDEDETIAKTQLDRSVVVPDQIRTVIKTFREKLFTDLFPDRALRAQQNGFAEPWIPKTLVFAKDDNHAEDIVTLVREEFGKGNDFCKKVTYKAGAKPEDMIKAFRTAPEFRIAVTVDMIATGTDIKPLECLLFLRDVRSQLYFEQMKGRGTRTIDPTDLATVTPDAGSKTRFVLVDAVGVTESDKTDSRPLERKPSVSFEKLLTSVALGVRDEDTLTSLANRLARLDRALSDGDKEELQTVGGISLKQLASNLLQATNPDKVEAASRRLFGPPLVPFNPEAPVESTEANLPHWRQDRTTYFVTFRLADSLPKEKLEAWKAARDAWLTQHPEPLSDEEKAEYYDNFSKEIETWLDRGSGSCVLSDPDARTVVENALRYFDGERYHLGEHVVAGNHVHAIVTPLDDHKLSDIIHSWKSFTAKELLKLPAADSLATKPTVWQKESYDHIVRSSAALAKIEEYIRAHSIPPLSNEHSGVPPHSMSEEDKRRDAASTLANEATEPLAANPDFRNLLETKRRDREVTIDHLSGDEVLATGYDEEKARGLIENWKQFLEANQDEITALQIIYNLPRRSATKAGRQLVYEELKTLADAVARPPYHIAPAEVWKAYEMLEGIAQRSNRPDPSRVLTNLITLVRHTVDPEHQPLAPFPELVEARYQQWLEQQGNKAGRAPFTDAQRRWLDIIKNTIALNGAFPTDEQEDYLEAWQNVDSKEGVPLAVARKAFGGDPKSIIEELNEVLVA